MDLHSSARTATPSDIVNVHCTYTHALAHFYVGHEQEGVGLCSGSTKGWKVVLLGICITY